MERIDQGSSIDDGTAGSVDQQRAALHQGKFGRAYQARVASVSGTIRTTMSARGSRAWRSETALTGGCRRGRGRCGGWRRRRVQAGLDGRANGAIADDEHGLAGEVLREHGVLAEGGAGFAQEAIGDAGEAAPLCWLCRSR